uniref:Uncharacterized protein n=1 Tax=uncultured marine virus TaxID=186617 RepID=A0A0F7LAH5_9VIRU|nr:hypothetical protein [uncultured marine virus]
MRWFARCNINKWLEGMTPQRTGAENEQHEPAQHSSHQERRTDARPRQRPEDAPLDSQPQGRRVRAPPQPRSTLDCPRARTACRVHREALVQRHDLGSRGPGGNPLRRVLCLGLLRLL